ncbi:major facilitator superfamily domain-containing protein [Daldinia vernicosa]|uniref:major facilitator superfamily domain-containing protein n=1 Tax=Daldinia vernicosa TaxID=114800 RepID=UPI002007C025|nr:major facilitator superfamily domain-containing protein [Daldinia vernicosa]KAI0843826.1 major facilitator superfamily domain-containing protein [Daldinia vernicosa]
MAGRYANHEEEKHCEGAVRDHRNLPSLPSLQSTRLFAIIGGLCLGTFLFGLDLNIIGVAIPPITTEFRSLADVAWYGSAYMLTLTAFQPLFGNLNKFFNPKVVYMISLSIFEVGSIVSAAAPRSDVLIVGRAILGLGAAGLLQGALAIIGLVVAVDKVPLYIGIVVSSMALSVCCGPVIGGALTEFVGWRWCFWINVPAGACVLIIIFFFVNISEPSLNQTTRNLSVYEKIQHMDFLGLILFLGSICCLLLVLTWGGQVYPWNNGRIIGLFVVFGVLTIGLIFWLVKRGDLALIPLRVLRNRTIYMGSITLVGYGITSVVYGYYLPILFQSVQGVSTTESGIRYIALVGPQIFAIVVTGALVSRWGYYVSGGTLCCIGSGLLTTVDLTTPTIEWAAYLVIIGLGLGMAAQIPYTALQAVLEPEDVATGNAIAVFSFHLAGAIGTAIGQTLLIDGLNIAVPHYTSGLVSPAAVIQAGATGLTAVAPGDMQLLQDLRWAYGAAVRRTIILGLAGACLTVPASCGMEWLNIKRIAEERERRAESSAEKPLSSTEEEKTDKGGPEC